MRAVIALLVIATLTVAPSSIAQAHSSLVVASPSSMQTVGGTIERLDLLFNDGVGQAEMTLEGPGGIVIEGIVEQLDDNWLRYSIEPLTVEGRYVLAYSFISADTDPVSSAYAFTYEAAAHEPIPITSSELNLPAEGPGIVFWVGSFLAVGALAIGGGLAAERVRKQRLARGTEEPVASPVD